MSPTPVGKTGGRFNPTTNSWTATSTTNAPAARFDHTAIWNGTEMIVWGGSTGDQVTYFADGGRYNPTTNTWLTTAASPSLSARSRHTAIWTGSVMIVWGGRDGSAVVGSGSRYDPVVHSWANTSSAGIAGRYGIQRCGLAHAW